jgi:hypothetical protein
MCRLERGALYWGLAMTASAALACWMECIPKPGRLLAAALLFAITACDATSIRWQKADTDPAKDESECRTAARQEAARQLPYGNGPPIFGYPKMSMLQWTQMIDYERYYFQADLLKACMRERGFRSARPAD